MTNNVIAPGGTICILGAGQLGKMTLMASHRMGYNTMVWAPEGDIPAMDMATHRLVCPYDCPTTLDEVVRNADVITTEWENIPLWLIKKLERRGAFVRPGSRTLEVAQSRNLEKELAKKLGIVTAEYVFIPKNKMRVENDWQEYLPGILKTDRDGYDGKGQWPVNTLDELCLAIATARKEKPVDLVLEKKINLYAEVSVLVARTTEGRTVTSDVVENVHKNGILRTSQYPMKEGSLYFTINIQNAAEKVANHLGLEGILVLEFFIALGGDIIFNEMAPRPHNSFHASIEASFTSQFEQHVRAICNLPLGNADFHTSFTMVNLIGEEWEKAWLESLKYRNKHLHLYGKKETRAGRKMGHITRLR